MDLPLFDLCHRNSSVSSLESLEAWMESYVPLSNLPTPPPSQGSWSPQLKFDVPYDDLQNEDLISPSIYLANMIPKPACVVPASPLIIQAFLHRAAVQVEVVALAACVIDRLSNKFALNWRRECPLVCRDPGSVEGPFVSVHGDCHGSEEDPFPRPEIVALASLMLAVKFLDDREGGFQSTTTSFWAQRVSGGRFSCAQLNTTERLILCELDFRIQLFCTPACISSALRALRATGKQRSGTREVERVYQRDSESIVGASSGETHVRFNLHQPALTNGDNGVTHGTGADDNSRRGPNTEVTFGNKNIVPVPNNNLRRAVTLSIQQANRNLFLRHGGH